MTVCNAATKNPVMKRHDKNSDMIVDVDTHLIPIDNNLNESTKKVSSHIFVLMLCLEHCP